MGSWNIAAIYINSSVFRGLIIAQSGQGSSNISYGIIIENIRWSYSTVTDAERPTVRIKNDSTNDLNITILRF